MATDSSAIGSSWQEARPSIYRICLFEPGAVVPKVQLFSAAGDEQAVALASTIDPATERELWNRHRLVAYLPAVQRAEAITPVISPVLRG